ncbi:MAG: DNA repair protein RadC [Eubacteriales bacterium]|nr:DNA repair protein RadC [Eubacteriales bacterium]
MQQDMHTGHRERLRKRFFQVGLRGFSEHEVLELLLTFVIPRKDTNPIAHALIKRFGSLHKVLEANLQELKETDGIGDNAAALIMLMLPLMRQYLISRQKEQRVLKDISAYKAYARSLLIGEIYEHFEAVAIDAKGSIIANKRIASGDEGLAVIPIRRLMSFLLSSGAYAVLLAHNHPQGEAVPSPDDIKMTHKIQSLCLSLGIKTADHIIIANTKAYSFRENNLLNGGQYGKTETPEQVFD